MKFEVAFSELRKGRKIRRIGWMQQYSWLVLKKGQHTFPEDEEAHVPPLIDNIDSILFDHADVPRTKIPTVQVVYNKTKSLVFQDLSSIDLLTEDWYIVTEI